MQGLERIDKIVDDMVDVKADLENDIKSRDARIEDLEKKVEDVVSDTSTLLNETKSKNANFVQKLNENTRRINELEKKLEDVVSDTSTLLHETKTRNAGFNKTMIEKDARFNEIEKKLDNVIAVNTSLSAELKAKNSFIEKLETKLDVFNDRLTALNENFDTKKKISPLKSKNRVKNTKNMVKIITAELADLVNAKKDEVLKCDQIRGRLWKYIWTNNLHDPENKRLFTPDDKMKSVFGKDKITRRSMNNLIKSHTLEML